MKETAGEVLKERRDLVGPTLGFRCSGEGSRYKRLIRSEKKSYSTFGGIRRTVSVTGVPTEDELNALEYPDLRSTEVPG